MTDELQQVQPVEPFEHPTANDGRPSLTTGSNQIPTDGRPSLATGSNDKMRPDAN